MTTSDRIEIKPLDRASFEQDVRRVLPERFRSMTFEEFMLGEGRDKWVLYVDGYFSKGGTNRDCEIFAAYGPDRLKVTP